MENTKKIGIFNNKGGVAKTTSVINLAYSFQKKDRNVLVVDCDTQENCFSFFMTNTNSSLVLPTDYERISHTTWERYKNLTEKEIEKFDFVLFDLPPTISDEVRQIIRHFDVIYVPTILGEFEIAGLKRVTFVTMYQSHNDAEIIEEFRKILQDRLMKTVIPYSKTVRESQKAGLPIEAYFREKNVPQNKNSWKIVNAYEELANEIMGGC